MDKKLVICRCEEITVGEILEAIDSGASSLNEIKLYTRAGMGLCQGKTCSRLVAGILAKKLGVQLEEIDVPSHRPPIRPIHLGILAKSKNTRGIYSANK